MSEPLVTVWIQSCNRPELLKNALASVLQQTDRARIRDIIVVENGANRRSEVVCATFSELPITYVFRDPPLAPGTAENIAAMLEMLKSVKTQYIAILFDDDWWAPEHLARSLTGLREIPGSVGSFSACIITTGEAGYISEVFGSFVPWFAASAQQYAGRFVLSLADLIVASQINSSFHYSSLVVDRAVLVASIASASDGNPYDTDRLLSVEMGRHGKVLCDPFPAVFVRVHEGQENSRLQRSGEAVKWWTHSTHKILELAKIHGIDLRKEFDTRLKATGLTTDDLRSYSHLGAIDYLVRLKLIDTSSGVSTSGLSRLKTIARDFLPPIVWRGAAKIYHAAKNNCVRFTGID